MAKKGSPGEAPKKAPKRPSRRKAALSAGSTSDDDSPRETVEAGGAEAAAVALREQLAAHGYASVFDVVRQGRVRFAADLSQTSGSALDAEQADDFYTRAEGRAASLVRLYGQLSARSEPVTRALSKLGAAYDAKWMARALGAGNNYDDWFKPPTGTTYAHPESIGSLFSPGSYLTGLYRVARPLHPSSHGLQLDRRRPDLGPLKLTDTHLNQELSTLALAVEVLEAGVAERDETQDVNTLLREAVYPMTLPYNHAVEQIRQGLAAKKSSASQLWAAVGDHEKAALTRVTDLNAWKKKLNPSFVQDVLGVNPQLYVILNESSRNAQQVGRYYGVSNISNDIQYTSSLTNALKTLAGGILEALGTGPHFDCTTPKIWKITPKAVQLSREETTYHFNPDLVVVAESYHLFASAGRFVIEETFPAGPLQLRFYGYCTVDGVEAYFYRWDVSRVGPNEARPLVQDASVPAEALAEREFVASLDMTASEFPSAGANFEMLFSLTTNNYKVSREMYITPETFPISVIADSFVVKEASLGGQLELQFQSTVLIGNTESSDYEWTLVAEGGSNRLAMENMSARTDAVPGRTWTLGLGKTAEEMPTKGVAYRLEFERHGTIQTSAIHVDLDAAAMVVAPQTYGARYINGWATSQSDINNYVPHYWYIGPQVGHPDPRPTNNPPTSGLYKRSIQARDRLHRLMRLQRLLPLSFEELDWLIAGTAANITDFPLAQPLQALAVYLPLRQRFGLSVDSFVACVGPINRYHRPGVTSLFEERFGDPAVLLGRTINFGSPLDTPAAEAARAALCRGLRIDDGTLRRLARYLPDIDVSLVLRDISLDHIAALYRLVEIPRLWGLSVLEGLALWELLGESGAIARELGKARPTWPALDTLVRTGFLVDWMRGEGLEPLALIAMTSRRYGRVATPELQRFIENMLSTVSSQAPADDAEPEDKAAFIALLCRHIGAEFALKANTAMAMIEWMDAVAGQMNPELTEYTVLSFWRDVQAWSEGPARTLRQLEEKQLKVVQYVHLLRQFALVCAWAQLTEQDLALMMPVAQGTKRSPLTGETYVPTLTLDFLLLLSRYRRWQQRLVGPAAEGRRYLGRAAAGALTDVTVAVEELAALHGWDIEQTQQSLVLNKIPTDFVALQSLVTRLHWSIQSGLAPQDLALLALVSADTSPDQATLELIAAKVLAAAHV